MYNAQTHSELFYSCWLLCNNTSQGLRRHRLFITNKTYDVVNLTKRCIITAPMASTLRAAILAADLLQESKSNK